MRFQPMAISTGPGATSADVSISTVLGALQRRWLVIAACIGVAAALALGFSLTQKPVYTATALVLVNWHNDDLTTDQPVESVGVTSEVMDSQIEIARSRALLSQLAEAAEKAGYDLAPATGPSWPQKLSGGGAQQTAAQRREAAVDDLEKSLKIKRRRSSYVIEINAADHDRTRAAFLANTLARLFVDSQFDARVEDANRLDTWMSGRRANLKTELAQQERAVEDFRSANGLITSDGQMLTDQQASGLQTELVTARADLAEKAARYRQVQDVVRRGAGAETVAAVVGDNRISTLRQQEGDLTNRLAQLGQRFGEKHPDVLEARAQLATIKTQIRQETRRIVASLDNDVGAARARVAVLSADAAGLKNEINTNNRASVRLRELEREAAATRAVYESLLSRGNEIADRKSLKTSDVRLIAEAQPPRQPTTPIHKRALLLGLLAGLACGVGAAVLLELLNGAVSGSVQDVEALLNYNMLAAIPLVKRRQLAGLAPFEANPPGFLVVEPTSPYAEALQTLRSALEFSWQPAIVKGPAASGMEHRRASLQLIDGEREIRSLRHQGPFLIDDRLIEGQSSSLNREGKIIAVMSAVAGDGATTTAMALTRTFALAGRRALIVECDFHRQDLGQHLKRSPAMGLVHVLIGAATWRAALAEDHATSARVLVAKAPRPDADGAHAPVEDIFKSRAMLALLDDLRKNFDVVILDCPPVLARPETRVLGGVADTCLFVTRWGESPKAAAQAAIKRLLGAGAIIAGFAINGAQIDWARSYYDLPKRLGFKDPATPVATPDEAEPVAAATWKGVMAAIPERGA